MKHGLIFDLDGTLVDSLRGISASLNHALTASGLPGHPPETVRGFIGNGARALIERAAPGADDGLLLNIERDFKLDYDVNWPDGTAPYQGIPEMLETLQSLGHSLAVLSNKPHPFTQTIVARLFPGIRFGMVLGQRPGIPHKPDPRGALEICRVLQIPATDCIVIGDSTMDLKTAENAGMWVISVSWGYQDLDCLTAAGAETIAGDPAALLALLIRNPAP